MKQREPLKAVGYWRETPLPIGDGLPEPQDFINPQWRPDERAQIVSYLRAGKAATQWRGCAQCRLCVPSMALGSCDLTDGEWVWPQRLEHYVEDHGLFLPDEFVDSMRRHKWMVLIPAKKACWDGQMYDFSYWNLWAAATKASLVVNEEAEYNSEV